ncbi:RES family NAD+ phosphorylase [bacterium]|nr:RES family NAD+ phosphorylase [bacterium]
MSLRAVRVCARTFDPRQTSGLENRWNARGQHVLYLAEHFATAVLENLVYTKRTPTPAHAKWVTIPDGVHVEERKIAELNNLFPGWDHIKDKSVSRNIGAAWLASGTSACLLVPSVPGRPFERNIVLNVDHPDYTRLLWDPTVDLPWDPRLFG